MQRSAALKNWMMLSSLPILSTQHNLVHVLAIFQGKVVEDMGDLHLERDLVANTVMRIGPTQQDEDGSTILKGKEDKMVIRIGERIAMAILYHQPIADAGRLATSPIAAPPNLSQKLKNN